VRRGPAVPGESDPNGKAQWRHATGTSQDPVVDPEVSTRHPGRCEPTGRHGQPYQHRRLHLPRLIRRNGRRGRSARRQAGSLLVRAGVGPASQQANTTDNEPPGDDARPDVGEGPKAVVGQAGPTPSGSMLRIYFSRPTTTAASRSTSWTPAWPAPTRRWPRTHQPPQHGADPAEVSPGHAGVRYEPKTSSSESGGPSAHSAGCPRPRRSDRRRSTTPASSGRALPAVPPDAPRRPARVRGRPTSSAAPE
jgi:hypothetical protein